MLPALSIRLFVRMSYPASARNIPNNNIRRAKASWQDDITCHQINMPNQLRPVVSPNPHSLDVQGHVSERSDHHSLDSRRVRDRAANRWRRSTASQISVAALLHRLESVERQNEELRQRMSEMDRSNPSQCMVQKRPVIQLVPSPTMIHQTNGNLIRSVNQLHDQKSEE